MAEPTTPPRPTKKLDNDEPDTIQRCRFFCRYDFRKDDQTVTDIAHWAGLTKSTAHGLLNLRKEQEHGEKANRRLHHLSGKPRRGGSPFDDVNPQPYKRTFKLPSDYLERNHTMTGQKRNLDAYFQTVAQQKGKVDKSKVAFTFYPPGTAVEGSDTKRQRLEVKLSPEPLDTASPPSTHHTYPHAIASIPSSLQNALADTTPPSPGRAMTNGPALDLLYFEPFIARRTADELFRHLRASLPFYRVRYTINRGGSGPVDVTTPRYTTVFGVDESCVFASGGGSAEANTEEAQPLELLDAKTRTPVPSNRYSRQPRPLPASLAVLRDAVQRATGCVYNFCLVNYYASGADSISMHSDDEKFLGRDPAIASLSLGARRDFVMKHKQDRTAPTLKLPLASGDMVLMRGTTQGAWLHGVPKRSTKTAGEAGRINITFRKAVVRGGTENYYRYNVGDGECWRWDDKRGEMVE